LASEWRLNVWRLGLVGAGAKFISELRTPFAGIEYICRREGFLPAGIYVVRRSPVSFDTFGWVIDTVPYVIAPVWPGFFDVYPD